MTDPAGLHELAAALRGLRQDANLSTTQLAQRLGWSQSRVSRVERGVTVPKPPEVEAWTRELGLDPDRRRALLDASATQAAQLVEWKRELAPGRRRKQQEIAELEAAATVVRVFSTDVIPGLAQTRPYVEAMYRLGRGEAPGDDPAQFLDARVERQAVLDDTGKRFELLMSETAIRRGLLPAAQMREQLDHLAEVAKRPNVHVGLIPFTASERVHQYHSFAVLGDPDRDDGFAVLAETVTRALAIRDDREVRDYIAYFDQLSQSAIWNDDAAAFCQEVSAQHPWS